MENESERFQRKQDQAHRQRNRLANVMCEQDFFKRRETALDKLTLCHSREWVTNRLISQLKSWKIQKSSACKFMTNTDLRSCLMKRGQTSSHHDMSVASAFEMPCCQVDWTAGLPQHQSACATEALGCHFWDRPLRCLKNPPATWKVSPVFPPVPTVSACRSVITADCN